MDIEDDFIEDSSPSKSSSSPEFFITHAEAEAPPPAPVPLKPAVNVLPLTELSRKLLSSVEGLMLFGSTSVGTTLKISVYDLGKQMKSACANFPVFFSDVIHRLNSPEHRLVCQLERVKKMKKRAKENRNRLRANARHLEIRFKQQPKDESPSIEGELKSVSNSLAMAIKKLRDAHSLTSSLQDENAQMREELNRIYKRFKKKTNDQVRDLKNALILAEIDFIKVHSAHKENLESAKAHVKSLEPGIHAYERRVEDINQKLQQYKFVKPLRDGDSTKRSPYSSSKLSYHAPQKPKITVPKVVPTPI